MPCSARLWLLSWVLPVGCLFLPTIANAEIKPDAQSATPVPELTKSVEKERAIASPQPKIAVSKTEAWQAIALPIPPATPAQPIVIADSSETPETATDPSVADPSVADPSGTTDAATESTVPEASSTDTTTEDSAPEESTADSAPDIPPTLLELARRRELLREGDRLWLAGQYADAERLYREAKGSPVTDDMISDRPPALYDPTQLTPEGQVYWREAEAGAAQNLVIRTQVPLELLTDQYPEFIPAQIRYANLLIQQEHAEEALAVLERAATLYPNEPELIRARVDALAANEQWMEASIAARQFALLNPDSPDAPAFTEQADEYLAKFRAKLREDLTGRAIANTLTGALGFVLTGNPYGPIAAISTAVTLLRGESSVGAAIANRASRQLDLIDDEEVLAYVNDIGQRLAAATGRTDFDYQFYVVRAGEINAFALPGGKVFINAGAILRTESEAELAGLIAHELSHAVLSHSFEMITQANLTANMLQFIPYGGFATNLAVLSYSRDMEQQADVFGTRLLASTGYAADGMYDLMQTMDRNDQRTTFEWLSTHPDTGDRVRNISNLIEENGYNRYAYAGMDRHAAIQRRLLDLLFDKDFENLWGTPAEVTPTESTPPTESNDSQLLNPLAN